MPPSSVIEQLKAAIARIEGTTVDHHTLPFGVAATDDRLPGGGVA